MLHQRRVSLVAQTVKNPPTRQKTQIWSVGWEDPLDKGMATHSSILTWESSMDRGACRLQFMGSQRVSHDWATNTPCYIKETKEHCQENLNFQTKRNYWVLSRVWNFILKKKFKTEHCLHLPFFCIVLFVFRNIKLWIVKSYVPTANTVTYCTWISLECQTCFLNIINVEWCGVICICHQLQIFPPSSLRCKS